MEENNTVEQEFRDRIGSMAARGLWPSDLGGDIPDDLDPAKTTKFEESTISIHPVPTASSLEPAHVAQYVGRADSDIRLCLDRCMAVPGKIFSDDLDSILESKSGGVVLGAFDTVLNHSFKPTPSGSLKMPGWNVPVITMLEHMISEVPRGGHVLVIEARPNDDARIRELAKRQGGCPLVFHLQSPSALGAPSAHIRYERNTLDYVLDEPKYAHRFAAVFFPTNFANLFCSQNDGAGFLAKIKNLLAFHGRIYGTYLDVDDLRRQCHLNLESSELGFVLKAEYPMKGPEGTLITNFGGAGKDYEDWRLTEQRLAQFVPPDDVCVVRSARDFFNRVRKPPGKLTQLIAVEISAVRMVCWETGTGVARPRHFRAGEAWAGHIRPVGRAVADLPEFRRPDGSMYQVNRGAPFADEDLFYLHPSKTWVNRKADGRETMIAYGYDRTVIAYRGDPAAYELLDSDGSPFKGPAGMVIQVEAIGEDLMQPEYMVFADVVTTGATDCGYMSRLAIFSMLNAADGLGIYIPPRVKLKFHTEDLNAALDDAPYPTDGFVLNYEAAPGGMFHGGIGAARYVKDVYTIDVMRDGVIVEETLAGNVLRARPDKLDPNTAEQIARVRRAWTPEMLLTRIAFLSVPPFSFNHIATDHPRPKLPHYSLSEDELAHLWCPWRARTMERVVRDKGNSVNGQGDLWLSMLYATMVYELRRRSNIMPLIAARLPKLPQIPDDPLEYVDLFDGVPLTEPLPPEAEQGPGEDARA